MSKIDSQALLYGILDLGYVPVESSLAMTRHLLEGGVGVLQLRAKNLPRETIRDLALQIAPLCRKAGVPFILNDYPDLVKQSGADGVHVGQDDTDVPAIRRMLGPDVIIGLSTHSVAQARAAVEVSPDYIGFGPLFATPTKPDYHPIGIQDIAEVYSLVPIPIFCIGGIKRENLPTVCEAGARRAVVVSGILQAADPSGYARDCLKILSAVRD